MSPVPTSAVSSRPLAERQAASRTKPAVVSATPSGSSAVSPADARAGVNAAKPTQSKHTSGIEVDTSRLSVTLAAQQTCAPPSAALARVIGCSSPPSDSSPIRIICELVSVVGSNVGMRMPPASRVGSGSVPSAEMPTAAPPKLAPVPGSAIVQPPTICGST